MELKVQNKIVIIGEDMEVYFRTMFERSGIPYTIIEESSFQKTILVFEPIGEKNKGADGFMIGILFNLLKEPILKDYWENKSINPFVIHTLKTDELAFCIRDGVNELLKKATKINESLDVTERRLTSFGNDVIDALAKNGLVSTMKRPSPMR